MEKDDFKAITDVITGIQKDFGRDRIIDTKDSERLEKWLLRSISLNYLFGGGFPKGRVVEFSGEESAGKTLLAILIAIEIQRQGGFVVFYDYEYAFDPDFYESLGLSLEKDKFILIQPDYLEEGLTIVERFAKTGKASLQIIDSSNSAKSKAEDEKEHGEFTMGSSARAWSTGLKKSVGILSKNKSSLIIVSQIRLKIGVSFGDPRVRGVGNSIKFYSSIRCDVKRAGYDEDTAKDVTGINMKIKAFKNKCGTPMREIELNLDFADGLDYEKEVADFSISLGLVEKAGSWIMVKEGLKFQGKDNFAKHLKTDKALFEELRLKVLNRLMKVEETTTPNESTPTKRVSKKDKPIDESVLASIGGSGLEEELPVKVVVK